MNDGYVYVFGNFEYNLFKIGASANPRQRMIQLAQYLPFPVEMVCTFKSSEKFADEKALHSFFEAEHVYREWYELSARDIDLLSEMDEIPVLPEEKRKTAGIKWTPKLQREWEAFLGPEFCKKYPELV